MHGLMRDSCRLAEEKIIDTNIRFPHLMHASCIQSAMGQAGRVSD
jgi:hypothetical protein